MTDIAMVGAGGRMGRMIITAMDTDDDLNLIGAVERPDHPFLGRPVHEVMGCGPQEVVFTEQLPESCDVVVDFSAAENVTGTAAACAEIGAALMVGTTGLDNEARTALERASASVPVLLASNTSPGINLLLRTVREVAGALGMDYDIEIVETHHHHKKDAPSGTALSLAESAAEGRGQTLNDVACFGRQGQVGARPRGEIGLHAVRGGDVVGEHRVLFAGAGELIEITHRAQSREVLARGAVRAARFLAGKPAGRYTMEDVLFGRSG